jgi:hypothetical protein
MAAEDAFVQRTKAVTAYLRSLKDLERKHRTPGRGFYRATAAITASRAASFIMMYNCIEFGIREATVDLRREIASGGCSFVELHPYWREEIARAKFHDKLKQGINHLQLLKEVALFAPGDVDWANDLNKIPFAGNVDNQRLIDFVRRIDHRWRPPPSTLGGSDLDLIRRMRNDLAHGKEEFESVGASFGTDDLLEKYQRARTFMVSLIKALDRYRAQRRYLVN